MVKPEICIRKSLTAVRQVFRTETTAKQIVTLTYLNSP